MSQTVADLLAGALDSFQTLFVELTLWSDPALMLQAWNRTAAAGSRLSTFRVREKDGSLGSPSGEALDEVWRVWWKKPDCWRDEFVRGTTPVSVNMVRGRVASTYISTFREVYTNDPSLGGKTRRKAGRAPAIRLPSIASQLEQIALLQPPFSASGWTLRVLDETQFLNRSVIHIDAQRTAAAPHHPYWEGVDRFTAFVDAERGLPLRMAAIVAGAEAATHTAHSIRFDQPIDEGTFQIDPPAGAAVVKVD